MYLFGYSFYRSKFLYHMRVDLTNHHITIQYAFLHHSSVHQLTSIKLRSVLHTYEKYKQKYIIKFFILHFFLVLFFYCYFYLYILFLYKKTFFYTISTLLIVNSAPLPSPLNLFAFLEFFSFFFLLSDNFFSCFASNLMAAA